MTWITKPCPKPKVRKRRKVGRVSPMKKSWMKCGAGSKRRNKSSFPKQRDRVYTKWLVTENECLLAARFTRGAITLHDTPMENGWYLHQCWGPTDPAHVGEHRSRGAPDFAQTVPLCRAAHSFYDEKRERWAKITKYTEKRMANEAAGFGLKYVERGGVAT